MANIDIAYIPIVGRGLQINIICALHGIDAKFMMSKPMGDDFDKNTEAPFGTIPWLKDHSNGIELNDSLAIIQYLVTKYPGPLRQHQLKMPLYQQCIGHGLKIITLLFFLHSMT